MTNYFFINRRSGGDRRLTKDQRVNPRLDLSYRRRRKTINRRSQRNITDDFYASETALPVDKPDTPSDCH